MAGAYQIVIGRRGPQATRQFLLSLRVQWQILTRIVTLQGQARRGHRVSRRQMLMSVVIRVEDVDGIIEGPRNPCIKGLVHGKLDYGRMNDFNALCDRRKMSLMLLDIDSPIILKKVIAEW